MRIHAIRLLVCSAVLLGCGGTDDPAPGPTPERSGGKTGTGSGGKTGAGGSGGAAPVSSSGGATGTTTGGTGGSSAGTGGATGGAATATDAAPAATDAAPAAPTTPGSGPYGCTGCKPIFDGKTLEGWEHRGPADAWVVKDGALASNGKANDIWTKEDFGSYRIFFEVRQVMGNHKPDVIFFGTRPAPGAAPRRGLGGAQFQPPNGGSWDYGAGGTFARDRNPGFNANNWHQCEVLVKETGSFKAACCPMMGATPCKGVEVLRWMGKGKKHPFGIQMHNPGLFDEYKNILVERDPTVDDLLSTK